APGIRRVKAHGPLLVLRPGIRRDSGVGSLVRRMGPPLGGVRPPKPGPDCVQTPQGTDNGRRRPSMTFKPGEPERPRARRARRGRWMPWMGLLVGVLTTVLFALTAANSA